MEMLDFDVILGMDWLTAYRVVINYERRRVTANTKDGTRVVFQGDKYDILPQIMYEFRSQGQLEGWLAKPYLRGRGETRLRSNSSSL